VPSGEKNRKRQPFLAKKGQSARFSLLSARKEGRKNWPGEGKTCFSLLERGKKAETSSPIAVRARGGRSLKGEGSQYPSDLKKRRGDWRDLVERKRGGSRTTIFIHRGEEKRERDSPILSRTKGMN